MNKALDLLHGLVREVERKTCGHEETHRGGAIWEICDSCGAKWADDEGGKPEFAWPESVEKARAFLATHHAVEQAGGDERAAFELFVRKHCGMPAHIAVNWDAKFTNDAWEGWKARAALAQPSPAQAEQAEVKRLREENANLILTCASLDSEKREMQHKWDAIIAERDAALARCAELEAKLSDPTAVHQWQFSNAWFDCSKEALLKAGKEGTPIRTLYTAPAQAQHSVPDVSGCRRNRSALTDAQMRRLYDNSTEAEKEHLGFAAFARLMRLAEAVHQIAAASGNSAQHSVPEGWMLVECGIWTQEQVDEMQKTVARFRNSEFVDDRALAMAVADAGQCKAPEISLAELLAGAPGKEVGHE
ncbi:hypothetical protein ABZR11_30390 [Pseudomonas aeruginosa]